MQRVMQRESPRQDAAESTTRRRGGRHLYGATPMESVSITISHELAQELRQWGKGNLSAGIRELRKRYNEMCEVVASGVPATQPVPQPPAQPSRPPQPAPMPPMPPMRSTTPSVAALAPAAGRPFLPVPKPGKGYMGGTDRHRRRVSPKPTAPDVWDHDDDSPYTDPYE